MSSRQNIVTKVLMDISFPSKTVGVSHLVTKGQSSLKDNWIQTKDRRRLFNSVFTTLLNDSISFYHCTTSLVIARSLCDCFRFMRDCFHFSVIALILVMVPLGFTIWLSFWSFFAYNDHFSLVGP